MDMNMSDMGKEAEKRAKEMADNPDMQQKAKDEIAKLRGKDNSSDMEQ